MHTTLRVYPLLRAMPIEGMSHRTGRMADTTTSVLHRGDARGTGTTDDLHALTHAQRDIRFLGHNTRFAVIQANRYFQTGSAAYTVFDGIAGECAEQSATHGRDGATRATTNGVTCDTAQCATGQYASA